MHFTLYNSRRAANSQQQNGITNELIHAGLRRQNCTTHIVAHADEQIVWYYFLAYTTPSDFLVT